MRIWSILLIKSDLKWCIHLSRSLFSYFNYLVSVSAGRPRSPLWLQLVFRHFWSIKCQPLLNYFVWLRITDEGSVPEMRIWSILLIKSDLKWCMHLSRSLFSCFNYLVSVSAGGPRSTRGHMLPSSTVDSGWFVAFESIKIFRVKIDWNCNFVGISFGLSLIWHFWGITFQLFELLFLAQYHWRGFSTRNAHMVHIVN